MRSTFKIHVSLILNDSSKLVMTGEPCLNLQNNTINIKIKIIRSILLKRRTQ